MAWQRIATGSVLWITLLACSETREPSENSTDPFGNARDSAVDLNGDDDAPGDDDFSNSPGTDAGAGGDPAAPGADGGSSAAPQAPGSTLPSFPGSGTSAAGDPLPNGMLCDSVPGQASPIPERIEECFFDKNDPGAMVPAATLEQVLECVEDADTVHIRLTFHPWFVDNTYGENSVGWHTGTTGNGKPRKGGHGFKDLVESDHAEILLKDAGGAVVMQFKLDYLSVDASQASGYGSLGVLGGEGMMILGDPAHVVRWTSSQTRNLNERGYGEYTTESPATDENYTPNPATPEWDYRVVYEAWIDLAAFGSAGFGGAGIEFVHASPSKASSNTVEVVPGKCPPCQDPDGCHDDPPPPPPPCGSSDPDAVCGDAGIPDDNGGMPVPEMVM
ncbi:MAG TPA: hypothetical protein VK509_06155 [Polyangiales bacterium]|nr:hypothetical protein [Polyangiales bacterium]